MIAMLGGFVTNIILDFLLVWIFKQGMAGAALATIIGQGVTFVIALLYFVVKKKLHASYGGEKVIATYACISYIICIIYMILQGVGDGSQPLMSKYYGEKRTDDLAEVKRMAYAFADAYTAAPFRWTDHDLVEYCICENYLSSTGIIADKIK